MLGDDITAATSTSVTVQVEETEETTTMTSFHEFSALQDMEDDQQYLPELEHRRAQQMKRRAHAHEELLVLAYSALSLASPSVVSKVGIHLNGSISNANVGGVIWETQKSSSWLSEGKNTEEKVDAVEELGIATKSETTIEMVEGATSPRPLLQLHQVIERISLKLR